MPQPTVPALADAIQAAHSWDMRPSDPPVFRAYMDGMSASDVHTYTEAEIDSLCPHWLAIMRALVHRRPGALNVGGDRVRNYYDYTQYTHLMLPPSAFVKDAPRSTIRVVRVRYMLIDGDNVTAALDYWEHEAADNASGWSAFVNYTSAELAIDWLDQHLPGWKNRFYTATGLGMDAKAAGAFALGMDGKAAPNAVATGPVLPVF